MVNPFKYLLNAEYRQQIKAAKAKKRYQAALIELATLYAEIISEALRRKSVAKEYKEGGKVTSVVTVDFDRIEITADFFIFWVNYPLPIGIGLEDLTLEKNLNYIEMLCQAPVSHKYKADQGFRYLVQRGGRVGGLRANIDFKEVLKKMPANLANDGLMTFPIGIGENDTLYTADFETMAHFIIAGTTGFGKSNLQTTFLCSLAITYSPHDLRFVYIDLKDSGDLYGLEGFPHLGVDSLINEFNGLSSKTITTGHDTLTVLGWANEERKRRNDIIRRAGARKLYTYNRRNKTSQMPRIVIIIDELAILMLDSAYKKDAKELIAKIVATSRSSGIHLLLCTQTIQKDVLPTLINSNVPGRVVLYCSTGVQSGLALGDFTHDAHTQIRGIKGRAVFVGPGKKVLLQTGQITDHAIKEAVKASIAKWHDKEANSTTEQQLFEHCLNELDGLFVAKRIYQHFKAVTTVRFVKDSAKRYQVKFNDDKGEWEPLIHLNGNAYILAPPVRGPNGYGRNLTLLTDWLTQNSSQVTTKDDTPPPTPTVPVKPSIDPLELFKFALYNCDGIFSRDLIFEQFKGEITKPQLQLISQEWENKLFTIENFVYTLTPGAGRNPRRIIPIKQNGVEYTKKAPLMVK
jgi:hypothetical protein